MTSGRFFIRPVTAPSHPNVEGQTFLFSQLVFFTHLEECFVSGIVVIVACVMDGSYRLGIGLGTLFKCFTTERPDDGDSILSQFQKSQVTCQDQARYDSIVNYSPYCLTGFLTDSFTLLGNGFPVPVRKVFLHKSPMSSSPVPNVRPDMP